MKSPGKRLMAGLNAIAIAATLIAGTLLYALPLQAESLNKLYDSRILTPTANVHGEKRIVEVRNGDVLSDGALFQIYVNTSAAIELTVSFVSAQGQTIVLLPTSKVKAGGVIVLPSADQWYSLDEQPGVETIEISAKAIESAAAPTGQPLVTRHTITHVAADVLKELPALAGMSPAAAAPVQRDPRMAEPDRTYTAAIRRFDAKKARSYTSLLDRIKPDGPGLKTRGAKEVKLYKKVSPGVVLVFTDDGFGTGSVISTSGDVITNWHVVKGYKSIGIVFKPRPGIDIDASEVYEAEVVKVDEVTDLALLRIKNAPRNLAVIALGSLDEVDVGSDVHAIGHPSGETWTYTKGIVSQIHPGYEWSAGDGLLHRATVIQTQTPINPGNSGGPLLSDAGRIVGVNSFVSDGDEGLNYAVAVDSLREFLNAPSGRIAERLEEEAPACEMAYFDVIEKEQYLILPIDTDCNGNADIYGIDINRDREADYFFVDSNEDTVIEAKFTKVTIKGEPALFWIFYDGKGDVTLKGYDYDSDGEIDRYVKG